MLKKAILFMLIASLSWGCKLLPDFSVSLENTPEKLTEQDSISIRVICAEAVAFKFKLDDAAWSAAMDMNQAIIKTGLSNGEHILLVLLQAENGRWQKDSNAYPFRWTVDRSLLDPRASLRNLPAAVTNAVNISVNVSGNIEAYRFAIDDGELSAELSSSSPLVYIGLAEGVHTLYVIGKNKLGVWQDITAATVYTWEIDLQPPVVELTNLPYIVTHANFIDVIIRSSDILAFRYSIDGEIFSNVLDATAHIRRESLTEGAHTIAVYAQDIAGNWQVQALATTYAWQIDTSTPEIPLQNAPAAVTNDTTLNILVGDDSIVSYRYRLNYSNWSDEIPSSEPITVSGLMEGNNFISITAKDLVEVWKPEIVYSWYIDLTAPLVDAGFDIDTTKHQANLSANVSDEYPCTYLWEKIAGDGSVVFGDELAPDTTVIGIDNEEAAFILRMSATDLAGNIGTDQLVFYWDSLAPSINLPSIINWKCTPTTLNPKIIDLSRVTYLWEESTPFIGDIQFGDPTACPTTVYSLPAKEAIYYINLTVTDEMDNSSSATCIFLWDAITPGPVSALTAAASGFQVNLNWQNPTQDFSGVLVMRAKTPLTSVVLPGIIYNPGDTVAGATVVFTGAANACSDVGLAPNSQYYYRVFAYDKAYNYSGPTEIEVETTDPIAYVSNSGNNNNTGFIPSAPKSSIQVTIDALADLGYGGDIYVSAGGYAEVITMVDGISLYGGFLAGFSTRNPVERIDPAYRTYINFDDSSSIVPGECAVVIAQNVGRNTVLEGFEIIQHNADDAVVFNNGASPVIRYNTITGGYGIMNAFHSSPYIYGNIITGGDGGISYGIYNSDFSSPLIYNNVIHGGFSQNSCYGIYNGERCVPRIINNTICGGSTLDPFSYTSSTYGIYLLQDAAGAVIENNIIFCEAGEYQYGIYEYWQSKPASIRNNNFFDCLIKFHDGNGDELITTAEINSASGLQASGNISIPANFVDQVNRDWHLTPESGVGVRAGGLIQTPEITQDLDGIPRTTSYLGEGYLNPTNTGAAGWSMGAYELY